MLSCAAHRATADRDRGARMVAVIFFVIPKLPIHMIGKVGMW